MLPDFLSLTQFDYPLPDDRIAKFPLQERDTSKLLVYQKGTISHSNFSSLTSYLPKGTNLLFNNSKVVPARLEFFKEAGARIEVFLLEPFETEYASTFANNSSVIFKTLVGNKKRWRPEQTICITLGDISLDANWIDRDNNIVNLSWNGGQTFSEILEQIGKLPLPPYLNREAQESDYTTYQTVYADKPGAVAAPTAGLHFTENVLKELQKQNVGLRNMTLHVSAGTFLPVTVENVLDHPMHSEVFYFDKEDIQYLFESEQLIPVGTTSMRMAESLYWIGVSLHLQKENPLDLPKFSPYDIECQSVSKSDSLKALLQFVEQNREGKIRASTRLMITPGYSPKLCKGLITNYHQPCSTLVMLVASVLGNNWKKVYQEALDNDYRFLSYGDSSLLLW